MSVSRSNISNLRLKSVGSDLGIIAAMKGIAMSMIQQKWVSILIVASFFLLGLAMWSLVRADDVYNFYFQKGAAPQNVIQGGSGQAASKTSARGDVTEEALPNSVVPSTSSPVPAAGVSAATEAAMTSVHGEKENPFTLSLGYGRVSEKGFAETTYVLGLKYAFTRSVGVRTQFMFRNDSDHDLSMSHRFDGLVALDLTPLRLKLFDHRFFDLSVFGGARSYQDHNMHSGRNSTKLVPIIGASALLSLNSNFGLELSAHQCLGGSMGAAKKGDMLSGALAFQF